MTPDEVAAALLTEVDHVHVAATPEGWHCFTFTVVRGGADEREVLCGDGTTIAEALEAVVEQIRRRRVHGPTPSE